MKKKLISILLTAALAFGLVEGIPATGTVQQASAAENLGIAQPFAELTGDEMIADMGAGWNLGNTMDGHTGFTPGETVWQNVKTTKKLIQSVHDMGFHTVRIPVTWGTMIDDANGYAINEAWLSRVQDIVDYCVSQDMYAIINIHHDGAEQTGWLRIATEDQAALEEKFAGVWKNIATAFKDYDEHLIFESMNEVRGQNMTVYEENQVIMKLNQIFVDTVRGTGSNNAKRWLMVPGKYNFIDSICNEKNGFAMPEDSVENRIILSVHVYTPWNFCGTESTATTTYSVEQLAANDKELQPLYDMYTSKGIPVVIGEYGCINKDNASERAFYLEGMNRLYQKYKLVGVYWDQGWYDRSQKPDYSFSIVDRNTGEPIEKEVTDAIMRGFFGNSDDYTTLVKNPEVIPMEQMQLSDTSLTLAVGESKQVEASCTPENTNDIVLWKTEDATVASVAYGKISANGIGTTKITAYSQSGSVSAVFDVAVTAAQAAMPCTELRLEVTEYSLLEEESAFLSPVLSPADTTESVYYRSSDESVVTVSPVGKLAAAGSGEAVVTVCTSGGRQAEVTVTVSRPELEKKVDLAINVYYNDGSHAYYSNEISTDIISVTGNGQYTLTFDCDRDLSEAAKAAGVSNLNKVTAIYIKDNAVASGTAAKTALTACNIRYDKIAVDGTELTLVNQNPKSALKESGIFDTNDPINSWDGSAVEEVTVSNYVASFTGMQNPKAISITFTLSEMCFEGSEPEPPASEAPSESPVPSENPQPSEPTQTPSPDNTDKVKTGDKVASGNGIYKVTKTRAERTVQFVKPSKKKLASATIPAAVKIKGKSYKVTSIAGKAFKNYTAIKKVTIGVNVSTIGKEAFRGCKNLKSIKINSTKLTLKKVGKKAFAGIAGKLTVKAPKKKLAGYQKMINKRK